MKDQIDQEDSMPYVRIDLARGKTPEFHATRSGIAKDAVSFGNGEAQYAA